MVTVVLGRVPLVVPLVDPLVEGRVLGLTPALVVALQTIFVVLLMIYSSIRVDALQTTIGLPVQHGVKSIVTGLTAVNIAG